MNKMTFPTKSPHVLIIGGGIGGLTLAQSLRKQGISFDVFERDLSSAHRDQGYAVGLYDLEGLFGDSLSDDVPPLTSTCHLLPLPLPSQVFFHLPGGRMMYVEDTPETPCIRANRARLREVLSTGVSIHYGKRAIRVDEDDEKVIVLFEDGTSATGDVLVGADGTFSSVRPHVLKKSNDEILNPFPTTCVMGSCQLSGADMEQQMQLGYSSYVAIGPDFTLFSGVNRVHVHEDGPTTGDYYWLLSQNDETVGRHDHWLKTASQQDKLDWALKAAQVLEPKFRVTVEKTVAEGIKSNVAWWDAAYKEVPPVNRVLLIGDAAHPMTPIRGEGAIYAIKDAVQLGKVLAEYRGDGTDFSVLRSKLNECQQDMVAKGYESIIAARSTMANAREGKKTPVAWGHELRPVAELTPLPVRLT